MKGKMKMSSQSKAGSAFLLACCFCMVLVVHCGILPSGADAQEKTSSPRPRIGIVLGGGGAKGMAHIGVLKVIEELKIPVDYIAGTSMGAIVGALYASGRSAGEIENLINAIDWNDVLSGESDRKDIDFRRKREDYQILTPLALGVKGSKIFTSKGLVKDQKVNVLFEMLMLQVSEIEDFDKLPIPYRAIAADVETGEMVVLKSGKLADAARASMSVPGAFPPVEVNGRVLIDGGIVRNVPVDIVRNMGADIIICVDVSKPLATRKDLGGPVSIMNQMLDIMMKKNVEEQIKTLGPMDVYINPILGELGSGDFDKGAKITLLGEKAAREKTDALKRYAVSGAEYAAFSERHHRDQVKEIKISSIQIEVQGESNISPEVVAGRLELRPGDTTDIKAIEKNAELIYGTGDFERVDLHMNKQNDGYDLLVKAKEKSWGPNYLRFGIALESDFEGWSEYNILIDYTRRWINSLGAEWKTQVNIGTPSRIYSEFYQPLTEKRFFFVSPHILWEEKPIRVYDGDTRVAQYDISRYEGGIDLGIQPSMYGEARVGLQFTQVDASQDIGRVDLPADNAAIGAVVARGRFDQLDNVNFPTSGYLASFELFSSLKELGSDDSYNKISANVGGAFTFRDQTILAAIEAGTRAGNELPFYDNFELGGFLNLSGFQENQLRGQSMAFGRIITYHKLARTIIGDLYSGVSLESGNAWDGDIDLTDLEFAGSVFVGFDSVFGPLYLGVGHAGEDRTAGYFYLGRMF